MLPTTRLKLAKYGPGPKPGPEFTPGKHEKMVAEVEKSRKQHEEKAAQEERDLRRSMVCRSKTDGRICEPSEIVVGNAWDNRVGGFDQPDGDGLELARQVAEGVVDLEIDAVCDLDTPGAMIANGVDLLMNGDKYLEHAACRTSNLVCEPRRELEREPDEYYELEREVLEELDPRSEKRSFGERVINELFPSAEAHEALEVHPTAETNAINRPREQKEWDRFNAMSDARRQRPRSKDIIEQHFINRSPFDRSGAYAVVYDRGEFPNRVPADDRFPADPDDGAVEVVEQEGAARVAYLPPRGIAFDQYRGTKYVSLDRRTEYIEFPRVEAESGKVKVARGRLVDRRDEAPRPIPELFGRPDPPDQAYIEVEPLDEETVGRLTEPLTDPEFRVPPPFERTLAVDSDYESNWLMAPEKLVEICEENDWSQPPEGESVTLTETAPHPTIKFAQMIYIPPENGQLAVRQPDRYRIEYPEARGYAGHTTLVRGRLVDRAVEDRSFIRRFFSPDPVRGHAMNIASIRQTTGDFLEPFRREVVDFVLNRPSPELTDTVYIRHPVTEETYALSIPYATQLSAMRVAGLRENADAIHLWLQRHRVEFHEYLGAAREHDDRMFLDNYRHRKLLGNLPVIPVLGGGIRYRALAHQVPASYFDPGNPEGFGGSVPLGDGVSIKYRGSIRAGRPRDPGTGGRGRAGGGGSTKIGGWEIVGTALLSLSIKLAPGTGCTVM